MSSNPLHVRHAQALTPVHPTILSAPPTAPSVAIEAGTLRILIANWIFKKMIVARCQLTVRKSTPSSVNLKTSCASLLSSATSSLGLRLCEGCMLSSPFTSVLYSSGAPIVALVCLLSLCRMRDPSSTTAWWRQRPSCTCGFEILSRHKSQ